jgi:hypothetical protein
MEQRLDVREAPSQRSFGESGDHRVSVLEAVSFAYQFLVGQFWPTFKVSWLPFTLAGAALYFCLLGYLAELRAFLAAPDPRVACRALGVMAAGMFFAPFCYTIASVAIADLASGRSARSGWLHLRAGRQEWLLYAAYLRFLLFLVLLVAGLTFVSVAAASVLSMPARFVPWVSVWASVAGAYWFYARAGFLLAPLACESEAASLRRAWTCSSGNFWRIGAVIFALLIPGLVVESLGEVALRVWDSIPFDVAEIPLADYAQFMAETLPGWLVAFSVFSFVTIVLLTAGSVAVYDKCRRADPLDHRSADSDRAANVTGTISVA